RSIGRTPPAAPGRGDVRVYPRTHSEQSRAEEKMVLLSLLAACETYPPRCTRTDSMALTAGAALVVDGLAPGSASPPALEIGSSRVRDQFALDGSAPMTWSEDGAGFVFSHSCAVGSCASVLAPLGPRCQVAPEDMTLDFSLIVPADWPSDGEVL